MKIKNNNENGYNDYNNNENNKNNKEKRHYKKPRGLVIAVVVLAMLLSGTSLVALNLYGVTTYFKNQLENQYQRSFYDLTSNVNNLEIKLSKLLVSGSKTQIQKNLYDVSKQTESTQINLSELPTTHETIYKTMRFVNQLGDFSKTLADNIGEGQNINNDDYATLEELYEINKQISSELSLMAEKLGGELKLVYSRNGEIEQANPLAEGLNNMQENAIDYPSMIYDGPFSDGMINAEIKGLTGEEVSKEEAEEKLAEYLSDFEISEISYIGDSDSKIATYNYTVILTTEEDMFVQMSKIGGYPVLINNKRELDNFTIDVEECITKAEEFIDSLGYENIESVWASDYEGNVYVNLAPKINNIIYYPDLIKVIIARDNGEVLGLETMSYLANHTERNLNSPAIDVENARNQLSDKIESSVKSEKLTLIPREGGNEILAWEFAAQWNDLKYFIYIDAETGEEIDVFRVIDSDEGTLII